MNEATKKALIKGDYNDFINQLKDDDDLEEKLKITREEIDRKYDKVFLDKLKRLEFYSWKKLYSQSEGDKYVVQFNEKLFEWMSFTIKPENKFFFTGSEIDREEEIKRIISEPDDTNTKTLKIFSKFFLKPRGKQYLLFLIDNWFLPHYDLESVKLLLNDLKSDNKAEKLSFLKTILANWKFLLFAFFIFPLFLTIFDYDRLWSNCPKNLFFLLEYFKSLLPLDYKSLIERQYGLKDIITSIWTFVSYFLITMVFWHIRKSDLKIRLYTPRLFAAIIIGYLPLLLGEEVWKFGMHAEILTVIILVTSCLFVSFLYLWYEVNKNVENRENAIERIWKIYTRGIMYSIISGIIVLDLICGTFYHNMKKSDIENYNNIFVGFFGVIDPKVLLVFFPLALLIGIFVQIIWEEKPITEPL